MDGRLSDKLTPGPPGRPLSVTTAELAGMRREAERLEHESRYAALGALAAQRPLTVREPLTYEPDSPHSFFLDAARATRLQDPAARERLARHRREMDTEMPRRREARARAAARAYEEQFAGDRAGQEALARMTAAGIAPFERESRESRALTRTDGSGGYFDPPIFLIDEYVPFAREASPFASLWHGLDLPTGVSVVNAPRIALGAATGPQVADIAPAGGRDIQDSLCSATVRTVAGISDVSRQWLEQGQGGGGFGVDRMLWADLTADLAQNVDGQCLLGANGSYGQILGVWPNGAIAAANGIVVTTTGTAWVAAQGTASIHASAAQLVSQLRSLRGLSGGWRDLAWVWHPWTWSLYTAQVDAQNRPLMLSQNLDALPDGAAGEYQNIAVYLDNNIPTTFGGTTAPNMGPISNGQYAAVPGTGAAALQTPLLLARPQDLYLFQGDIKMQVLHEVLAGSLQVRFRLHCYLASMPHRFVAAAASGSIVSAGGDVAHGTLTSSVALLQRTGSGY